MENNLERVCISVNSMCNLSCKYCYFHTNEALEDYQMSKEQILSILENIERHIIKKNLNKTIKIVFVGSGEPMITWKNIYEALKVFNSIKKVGNIEYFTVSNGTLITDEMIQEMKEVEVIPSISFDGPKLLHDKNRIFRNGKGSYSEVIKTFDLIKKNKMKLIVNTVVSVELSKSIPEYFEEIRKYGIEKIVFDRLVDLPKGFPEVKIEEYYRILYKIHEFRNESSISNVEIRNIDNIKVSSCLDEKRDCTMFGSSCGAGYNNLTFFSDKVIPCGRMFDDEKWNLGTPYESIEDLQNKMISMVPDMNLNTEFRDCLIDKGKYDSKFRNNFIKELRK